MCCTTEVNCLRGCNKSFHPLHNAYFSTQSEAAAVANRCVYGPERVLYNPGQALPLPLPPASSAGQLGESELDDSAVAGAASANVLCEQPVSAAHPTCADGAYPDPSVVMCIASGLMPISP